jgi:hypothetical protein
VRWAGIVIGLLAGLTLLAWLQELYYGVRPVWDNYIGIFAIASIFLLLFRSRHTTAH